MYFFISISVFTFYFCVGGVVAVTVVVVVASHFRTKYIKFHLTLVVPIFPNNHILAQRLYPYIAFPYFLHHQRQK